jgi:hypothetical protein
LSGSSEAIATVEVMQLVTWTDEWQVYLLAAQFVVLLLAAGVAGWQVLEARKLRLERNRPFVVVDFDLDMEKGYLIFFDVANTGNSLARDIRIEVVPPLESSIDVPVDKLKMLNDGIATLPPGKRLRTFFDMSFRRNEDEKDYPMTHVATVRYKDEKAKRSFEETYNLDLDQYMNMHFLTNHGLGDIYDEIKRTRTMMEKWGWSGGRGLVAMTPEEGRKEGERMREAMEERRRRFEEAE